MATRDDIKHLVQGSTDIVDLIGQQILLKQKGREFAGLCPFHDDKSPSMFVSPTKQIFHCFVCNTGGDVFGWMMKYHKMTFPEALKFLAERAGIKVQESGQSSEGASDRQILGEANQKAMEFFQKLYRQPQQGLIARDYITKRQISEAMVLAFQIGYAPDGWDGLVKAIRANHWNQRGFEAAGLISARQKQQSSEFRVQSSELEQTSEHRIQNSELRTQNAASGFYDRLRHRIIFPICDALGRPIAFGGRKIRDEDEPKYLNSPETALFNKSRTLYGLHLAKKAILDQRTAIIVEGYVDVIACHQHGASNVVATLGTALTGEHVRELKKYCDKVILTFDADAAGQRAANRAVEIFLTEEMDVAIAVVPEGKDPADLMLLPDGPQRFQQAMKAAVDALDYEFGLLSKQLGATSSVTAWQRTVEEFTRKLAATGAIERMAPARKAAVYQRLATLLRMPESDVREMFRKLAPREKSPVRRPGAPGASGASAAPAAPAGPARMEGAGAMPANSSGNPSTRPGTSGNESPFSPSDGQFDADGPAGPLPSSPFANTDETENPSNLALSDVASLTESARIGLARAERQLIGCLLRQPDLFHTTLASGRTLDEELTPGEMVTQDGRGLYQVIYDLLSEERALTLPVLLAEFAERQLEHLANLATTIDVEIEAMLSIGKPNLGSKLSNAAEHILDFHRQRQFQAQPAAHTNPLLAPEDALRRDIEKLKTSRSPLNIMRVQS